MKKLVLQNPSFRYVEDGFKQWLDVLGYAPGTVYYMPLHVRELLHYLEAQGIKQIRDMTTGDIENHYEKLKERAHQRKDGALSGAHLNKHAYALKKFTEYLRKAGRASIPVPKLDGLAPEHRIEWLTGEEIQQLFAVTRQEGFYDKNKETLPIRDRAMLAVYYGLGLRRNEGVQLDTGDINFDKAILHIRKGKNYKERLLPISKASLKHLQTYVYDARPLLIKGKTEALFISVKGFRMRGQSMNLRLKWLQYHADSVELKEKEIGLHTLRHSIATHLLQAGMKLESISRFLGHGSLESTQIYTHLAGISKEQPYDLLNKYEPHVKLSEDER